MIKDYYKILEVPRDASVDDIRQAYKELAKQYHPDRTATLGVELRELAARKMMDINEAFQLLSNPESRKEYDEELKKEEAVPEPAAPAPHAATGATAARPSGAKSDFWRDIERIEAERHAADEAAAVRATEAAQTAAVEPEKAKPKAAASRTVTRNVALDFIDKFYRGVMRSAKWSVDAPKGWTWVLDSGDWRKGYCVGYCQVDNLGMIGLKRLFSRIQALMDQKKGMLKQNHFFFLVSYDRLMDSVQVIDSCKSWAAEGRREGQRLIALIDGTSLSTQFFGTPEDDRMRSVVQLLSPRK